MGRKHKLVDIKRLLQTIRLLTLTGAPRTGTTRLALQVAANSADEFVLGVFFVALALLGDAQLTASVIAAALGVTETASEALEVTLKRDVADKQLLLVLDNFEHLLKSAALVAELLAAAPHLKVIVTSRERLNLYGEQEYVVPPLALPSISDQDLLTDAALDLARISGDKQTIAKALYAQGTALIAIFPEEAHSIVDEAQALFRELDDRWELARTLILKGELARIEGDYLTAEQFYQQALTLFRELGNPWGVNVALQNLAYVVQYRGALEQAKTLFAELLNTSQELEDRYSISSSLAGLAGIIGILGEPERAASLFGTAEILRETIGANIPAGDRADYERSVAGTRTQMDSKTFESLWQQGREMPLNQVIDYALKV